MGKKLPAARNLSSRAEDSMRNVCPPCLQMYWILFPGDRALQSIIWVAINQLSCNQSTELQSINWVAIHQLSCNQSTELQSIVWVAINHLICNRSTELQSINIRWNVNTSVLRSPGTGPQLLNPRQSISIPIFCYLFFLPNSIKIFFFTLQ